MDDLFVSGLDLLRLKNARPRELEGELAINCRALEEVELRANFLRRRKAALEGLLIRARSSVVD